MASNFKLSVDHDIIIGRGSMKVEGTELVMQNVKCRLLTFSGEWKRHPELGLPWRVILDKNYDLSILQHVIRNTIMSTNGIRSIDSLELEPDKTTRKINITFTVTTSNGSSSSGVSI